MHYTQSQQEVIHTIDQNLQIIACAGSGKTQVISARIVEILRRGADPSEIIAFTFTEKAAGELRDRIDRLCVAELGSNRGLGGMFVGTIHGYCLNLLQSPPLYRYLKYRVLDDIQQRLLIDRHSTQSGLTNTPLLNGGALHRWQDSRLYQQLISIYGEGSINHDLIPQRVHDAIAQYHQLLHQQRFLDYTMIIGEAVQELQINTQLRTQIASQVNYLVVDEYQDVNPLQELLIRLIFDCGTNLCVVGDDDQTIYQWRGSEVSNIITFADRYPNVRQVRLNENFRSNSAVINTALAVIERNPERLPKRMESTDAQPFAYGDVLALSFNTIAAEAEWIAEKIQELYRSEYTDRIGSDSRGLTYGDFAILLRSVRHDAGPIKEALDAAGIPYVVSGVNELFNTPEIQAMRAIYYYMADFSTRDTPPVTDHALTQFLRDSGLGLTPTQIQNGIAFLKNRKSYLNDDDNAQLFLQRFYLDFLEKLQIREANIPAIGGRTGEIVFYNLGKFSQVIADYEQIHFKSYPRQLYEGFASFLCYQAPDYYPEGWEEEGFAQLDAVQIMTVHKSKGMQWPAVFVPCLRRNRFPSRRVGGRQVWHVIPETAVPNVDRYKGTVEDERRLYYVAITRAERYLFQSWSPGTSNQYQRVSQFWQESTNAVQVLTEEPPVAAERVYLEPQPRHEEITLALTFSELKYFFDCPYSFKLRFLYGFQEPTNRAHGYGKSLHDMLAEIHSESIRGNIPTVTDVPRLVDDHLHLPYANTQIEENIRVAANNSLRSYLQRNGDTLDKLEHVEKDIELKLGDGIVVNGRIDLIRRTDTNDMVVVDFKSSQRAQTEEITRQQLQVYALGYEQLTGERASLIEIHNMDNGGVNRELVNEGLIRRTIQKVEDAGRDLRANRLTRLNSWCDTCQQCELAGICRKGESTS
ncbi:MAG: ATP-dependent helicase [Anaerolineaceae bacterium]|nr:ATP-dependent helicase [Anaerolineaceae bacterium]